MRNYSRFLPIQTRVAGVSFNGRQTVLEEVRSGDAVLFERQPHNAHDPEAVKVLLLDGQQLGYIPRDQTSYFGEMGCVGRVKSVGMGEGGYYGAQVSVQPQLPALLPPFLPPRLSLFDNPFEGYREDQLDELIQFLKNQENDTCAVTGLPAPLRPCLFWRIHPDLKQYEVCEIRLIHADLLPISQIQDAENLYLIQILAVVNGWTSEEAMTYVQSCIDRRDVKDDGWIVRSGKLRDVLKKLELPLPPALKLKSA